MSGAGSAAVTGDVIAVPVSAARMPIAAAVAEPTSPSAMLPPRIVRGSTSPRLINGVGTCRAVRSTGRL